MHITGNHILPLASFGLNLMTFENFTIECVKHCKQNSLSPHINLFSDNAEEDITEQSFANLNYNSLKTVNASV